MGLGYSRDMRVNKLADQLPPGMVLCGKDVPERNWGDASLVPKVEPLALVRPRTTKDVSLTLKLCNDMGLSVVPQGGMTGLVGGANPDPHSIALSLELMREVEEIDPVSSTAIVQAGVPLEALQEAAGNAGCMFGLDLGARGSCTVGGAISTNAGGNRVLRYGMMRELVLGVEAVLPNGTVIEDMNRMIKNNAGYDLKQLFIGSEGTLGIVTRAVLKLHAAPACHMAALCALPDEASLFRLLEAARRDLGPLLSAFEVMWPDFWNCAAKLRADNQIPLQDGQAFYVLIEIQGMDAEVDPVRLRDFLEKCYEDAVLTDGVVSASQRDLQRFWSIRDMSGELTGLFGPHCAFDIGVAPAIIPELVRTIRREMETSFCELAAVFYGHLADGNLHINAWDTRGRTPPCERFSGAVYEIVVQAGGTISAEHGIGLLKRRYLSKAKSGQMMDQMRQLKRVFDPKYILNPGKVV
ncbi:FAD-binding oxidoreductase [Nitratireductor sp.]|uniref:FAD-binding oxidoreductase n=1 Tax=Nitratireductor sp. TaxID=1872084 RepID=UPI0025F28F2F|nr:FAD-binding oxidoreductase [Nitratireductor sp.]